MVTASTFILFCVVFKWQIFASRLQLPFFVLFAPLIGLGLKRGLTINGARFVAIILVITAWPWIVHVGGRPLIKSHYTNSPSVIERTREEMIEALYGKIIPIVDLIKMKNVNMLA